MIRPTMNLGTAPGESVIFCRPENGSTWDQTNCKLHGLVVGQAYTVVKVRKGAFASSVELRGFRDIHFNTVHFENA